MKNINDNIIYNKSFNFALDVIEMYKYLCASKREYILSKQLLRSGTSIGANVSEALFAQTKKDFISKMHIALKETSETIYWINLLVRSNFIDENKTSRLLDSLDEISRILKSIITTSKENLTS